MTTFFAPDSTLQATLDHIVEQVRAEFSLTPTQMAITWVVYDPPYITNTGGALSADAFWQQRPRGASYRGVELIYPASVVKLFYLVAAHEWLEQGMVAPAVELDRALMDMIVDSSNDATSLVIDILSGTTSGPDLPAGPYATWCYQRNIINRFFQSLQWPELVGTNMNQKPWGDGPYGRERAFVGEHYENRNYLTTNAVARLVHSIAGGVAVSAARSQTMLSVMQRDLAAAPPEPGAENQVAGCLGAGLPMGTRLYSKAGYTSKVRHDAAYFELVDGPPGILVIFTEGSQRATKPLILPRCAELISSSMENLSPSTGLH
ncbi:serine hydrolase [Nodosilinea sp. LEGE 07088]|uniref:serine hydrolase n=1 Tax=Nodosilinea sp. LEGE 07088 TaxID=2777968 RepID=UPI00188297E2|nr:serine hydrolase [Nodosilinea sp. LEGE 07088]MBE9136830.1 serine hydrolase [Nodosilinea sp. LEGE 07088]